VASICSSRCASEGDADTENNVEGALAVEEVTGEVVADAGEVALDAAAGERSPDEAASEGAELTIADGGADHARSLIATGLARSR
jgi:hypothetical protein